MKKFFSPLLFAAVLLISCEQQQEMSQPLPKGKAIEFSMPSGAVNTKTAYGEVDGKKQAINWILSDKFTVWCDQAFVAESEQHYANYRISSAGTSPKAAPQDPSVQLMWGEGTHTFYAGYPMGKITGNKLSGTIPGTQKVNLSNGVYNPVLSEYGFMGAAAEATPEQGSVELNFKPLFSAIEFTVGPGPSTSVVIKDFKLKAKEGSKTALAGNFKATLSTKEDPKIEVLYDGENSTFQEISVNFGSADSVTIPASGTITFTILAIAQDLSDLTAVFTLEDEVLEFPLKKDDKPITFAAGKKSRINAPGILGPEAKEAGITITNSSQDIDDYTIDVPDPEPEP